jgi:hypothetical protein
MYIPRARTSIFLHTPTTMFVENSIFSEKTKIMKRLIYSETVRHYALSAEAVNLHKFGGRFANNRTANRTIEQPTVLRKNLNKNHIE